MSKLSIIVIHHRTLKLLKLCLDSIKKTVLDIDYELIVVDSMTTRETEDFITENYPKIKFLSFKKNLGYSKGVNIGIQESKGDYILILNPDIIATDNSIRKMLVYIEKHNDIGILGPKMLNFNGTAQRTIFNFYRPITIIARRSFLGIFGPFKKALDEFLMVSADNSKIQTPDWIMGSAMMVSKEAIKRVGGMDERFFMYFEDVDWCRRFWHNGYRVIYYPEAIMYHYHQRESKSKFGLLDLFFNQKTRWHIKSAIKFFWKYRNLGSVKSSKASRHLVSQKV